MNTKQLIVALFFAVLFFVGAASAQTCTPPPAGMVAWYPGDGNALDLQGGESGTFASSGQSQVTFAPGKVAQAFRFNGDGNSFVTVADQPALNPTAALTLDAWVNPTAGNGFSSIVFKGNGGSFANQPYSLFFRGDGDRRISFRVGNTSTVDALDSNAQLPLDAYTHVAATYDGTTMRIYINGVSDASKTTTIGTLADDNLPLFIGSFNFIGTVDELEIFNRALAQSEIQAIVAADSAGKCKPPITFTVNTTSDTNDGACNTTHCSLREAIIAANANAVTSLPDRIHFNIPGSGVQTITPTSALPAITDSVVIDGYTQPDSSPNTAAANTSAPLDTRLRVELDGTNAGTGVDGLTITGTGSTVRGLAINRFRRNTSNAQGGNGIELQGSGNAVEGCFIGTDTGGMQNLGNERNGVVILGANNRIGGTTPATRNLISGNSGNGIVGNGSAATANLAQGNFIGTDSTGIAAIGNGVGIQAANGANLTIGGAAAGARNAISGNRDTGIFIFNSTGTVAQGNYIGTKADGTTALGNFIGVRIVGSNNQIGGAGVGEGNVIAFNTGRGVYVQEATGNRILSNSIHSNGDLGIDLIGDGVTPNDPGDADTGANNLQNYPVLSSAMSGSSAATVQGAFNSTPNTTFRIEFFSNPACDSSGFGEGQTFIGTQSVTTDASGNATVNFTSSGAVAAGQFITSTATDPNGNTSEFSACRVLLAPTAASVGVSGRVMTALGHGISSVVVSLTYTNGSVRTTITNKSGYYHFEEVEVGGTYIINVRAKRYNFIQAAQVLNINEEVTNVNFIGFSDRKKSKGIS